MEKPQKFLTDPGQKFEQFKPTRSIDPEGYETLVEYDQMYRPLKTFTQYGDDAYAYIEAVYDNVGNQTHAIAYEDFQGTPFTTTPDPTLRQESETIYDDLYQPVEVRDSGDNGAADPNRATKTSYTSAQLAWKVEDQEGRITETEYDSAGRAKKVIQPEVWDEDSQSNKHPVVESFYDENSNVTKVKDPRGHETETEYDPRNRPTKVEQPELTAALGRPTTETKYDLVGNVTEVTDPNGEITTTTYDWNNRPTTVLQPEVDDPAGGRTRPKIETEYDSNGNPTKVIDPNLNETINEYDGLNRLLKTTDPELIAVENQYDQVGNLVEVKDGKQQITSFVYDGLKRNTITTDMAAQSTTLTYNALSQTKKRRHSQSNHRL